MYAVRNGKILIEPKADIKKRLDRSPDRADAYVRRGLSNVAIQAYLTAVVINLNRLVTYAGGLGGFIRLYFECICIYWSIQTPWKKVRGKIRSKPFLEKWATAA